MTQPKKVGFFFELTDCECVEALNAIRQESPNSDVENIVRYLEVGTICAVSAGIEEDVLSNPRRLIGVPNLLTDGTWVWPQTLVYYVRHYHIRLPDELLLHMRVNEWKCAPMLEPPDFSDLGEVSMG